MLVYFIALHARVLESRMRAVALLPSAITRVRLVFFRARAPLCPLRHVSPFLYFITYLHGVWCPRSPHAAALGPPNQPVLECLRRLALRLCGRKSRA